jgi:signal transduction histidine kinase/CheY-like chemotaxis protein
MWQTWRVSPKTDPQFVASIHELVVSTSRNVILVVGGAYLLWQSAATASYPETFNWKMAPVALTAMLTCALALRLLTQRFLAAQVVWQAGLAATITLSLLVFRQPMIGLFYALLPLMAVVTVGWPAGLIVEAIVIALIGWLGRIGWMPPLLTSYSLGAIVGGLLSGLVGWAATNALFTVTEWSLYSFEHARAKIDEAQEQRVDLKQAQEDLVLANQELSRLSDRLQAMYQVAEEARQAKEAFVANVSHELRTPLNMIIGFSEMITQSPQVYGGQLPATLLADIAAIQRNSQHLSKLVDDVLDLSQIEAGRMALSKEWASVREIVDTAALTTHALFDSKGLYLKVDVPLDLPTLFCDSTRIRQVVINLLSNAGRFTERGGVQIRAWQEQDDIAISVADTGPGIAAEDQKRLFEPFQQLDSSIRRRHGGSGLGLSISRRFVEMHGGKMWLESAVGAGTTIYFSLPLEAPPAAELVKDEDSVRRWFNPYDEYEYRARSRRSRAPIPELVPHFVILERGRTLQQMFSRYMDDVTITPVQDAEEARRALERSPARALVVNAPVLKDTPVPSQLANMPHGTPTVTCWVPGADEAAQSLGVMRYLVKPVSSQSLLQTLETLGQEVKTVLLVDDEPEALQLFARVLSSSPREYRILQATNGRRALGLLRERQPDVLLLDLIMPGLDGFQVLQQKSQDPSTCDIPVVIISSRDPVNEPIVSDSLTVTRGGGFSARDLLECIQAVSGVLMPRPRTDDRAPPGTPGG